jgi:hypothetical protein
VAFNQAICASDDFGIVSTDEAAKRSTTVKKALSAL